MKYANQIICLLSFLAWSGLSAVGYGNPQSTQGGLSENLSSISKPRLPNTAPEPETEYAMKIIKPSPHIDYKIVYVTPDPSINYTIRNVGPELGNPFLWGNGRLDGMGRRGCPWNR